MSTATRSPRTGASRGVRAARWWRELGWRYIVGLAFIFFGLFPVLYIVSASLNPVGSIASTGLIPSTVSLVHFEGLIFGDRYPFLTWYANTGIVSLVVALSQVACSTFAAYAFSRFRFRGRRGGLLTVLLIQMFPQFLSVVALYTMLASIGRSVSELGLDTIGGYILVTMGGALGNVWLVKGFLDSVPREIDEAARIDGAGHFTIFWRLILPLVRPVLAITFLLSFVHMVGEYMMASVLLTSDDSKTLAVGLYGVISNSQSNNLGVFAAGSVLIAAPVVVLFLYLQRFVVGGLSVGSVK